MEAKFTRFKDLKIVIPPNGSSVKWSQITEEKGVTFLRAGHVRVYNSRLRFVLERQIVQPPEEAEEFLVEHQQELSQCDEVSEAQLLTLCLAQKQAAGIRTENNSLFHHEQKGAKQHV